MAQIEHAYKVALWRQNLLDGSKIALLASVLVLAVYTGSLQTAARRNHSGGWQFPQTRTAPGTIRTVTVSKHGFLDVCVDTQDVSGCMECTKKGAAFSAGEPVQVWYRIRQNGGVLIEDVRWLPPSSMK